MRIEQNALAKSPGELAWRRSVAFPGPCLRFFEDGQVLLDECFRSLRAIVFADHVSLEGYRRDQIASAMRIRFQRVREHSYALELLA